MANYRHIATNKESDLEIIMSLIDNHDANPNVVDNYGSNPLDGIMQSFLTFMLRELENTNTTRYPYNPSSSLNETFKKIKNKEGGKISSAILSHVDNSVYELIIKKLRGESMQNLRKTNDDKNIYIGIASADGYYSNDPFNMATVMMSKHSDVRVRIITPDMINDEFIQQFDGLITPGAGDNFPSGKKEFTISDLNPNAMIPTEKLYQKIDGLADKYDIPTFGMCSGNQHIILYHKGTLMPVNNYVGDDNVNKHQGIFIQGSIPHFIALTPSEQRRALENCSLPKVTIDITTAHHYAGVKEKLGEGLKLGALSEEGVVQSVHDGVRFISFQFHPENYYASSFMHPNRNRLIWENFLEICRQRHRHYSYAKKHNLDFQTAMNARAKQNKKIIDRLQECAQKEALPLETQPDLKECKWFLQTAKRYNLDFLKMMNSLLTKQQNKNEIDNVQKCIQHEQLLTSSYIDSDEALPERKDLCDRKKFQWSDYDLLDYGTNNSYWNSTLPQVEYNEKQGEYAQV